MEEKINQEIRNYSEVMFFGLTMRQTVFSALAVVVAVLLYFLLRPYFGLETLSWVCILGAAPFASLGFCILSRHDRRKAALGLDSLRAFGAEALSLCPKESLL
jgi:hypothetical protein